MPIEWGWTWGCGLFGVREVRLELTAEADITFGSLQTAEGLATKAMAAAACG